MTAQSRITLKSKFENGDTPEGSDFADGFDSFVSLVDTTAQTMNSTLSMPILQVGVVSANTGAFDTLTATSASVSTLHVAGAAVTATKQNATNVQAYGAVGDGIADDTVAIAAALAAALDIYFPAGTYKISAALTLRLGQHIAGAGVDACTIVQNTTGNVFNCIRTEASTPPEGGLVVSILVENMTITAAVANVKGVVTQLCTDVTVRNVLFRGCAAGAVEFDRGYYNMVDACISRPTGSFQAGHFKAWSSDDANYTWSPIFRNLIVDAGDQEFGTTSTPGVNTQCIHFRRVISGFIQNFSGSRLNYPTSNVVDGIVMENDCQGCKIQGGVTFGAKNGIAAVVGLGTVAAPSYFTITDFDCDQFTTAGIAVNGNGSINCTDVNISKCTLTAPQNGSPCITMSHLVRAIIADNILDNYQTVAGVGVNLSSTNSVNIIDNQLASFTVGINLTTPTITTITESNLITFCTTAIAGNGITGVNNSFRHNVGWNPIPPNIAAPSVPASGVGATNTTAHDVIVAITGGTNVVWGLNGIPSGQAPTANGITFFFPANATMLLSYSSAPTWVWIGT